LGILDRISDWRARRRFGPVAGAMNENMEGVRVAKFATMLGASGRDRRSFLDAKWRLSEGGWSPRTERIPRPATAEEVSLKLGLTVDEVRSRDAALVEWGAKYVAEGRLRVSRCTCRALRSRRTRARWWAPWSVGKSDSFVSGGGRGSSEWPSSLESQPEVSFLWGGLGRDSVSLRRCQGVNIGLVAVLGILN